MTHRPTVRYADDAVLPTAGDFHDAPQLDPMEVDGICYLPATEIITASSAGENGADRVLVMLAVGTVGLSRALSPDGARAFAAALVRGAMEVEAVASSKADAAIDKARSQ